MPVCDGCGSTFSESGYSRHLAQTRNSACVSIYEDMHNYIPSSPGHSPHTKSHDNPRPFEGDYFDTTPEDLEWPVDEEDHNNLDDGDEDEEDEGEGGVAEQEADWEPPIGSAEEPEMNDQNIPMEEEGNVDGQRTRRHEAELPLHHRPYVATFPLDSAGSTINSDELESEQQNGYQSYGEKMTRTHSQDGGSCVWAPFTSHIDYEVARWAKLRGQGSTAFSDLLNIEGVCERLGLSYRNSRELNNIIDSKIPACRPCFKRQEILVAGEAFDVYFQDILQCVKALYGDPELAPYLVFAPERHYSDEDQTQRLYHDMYTGNWWWHTQKRLENDKPGATIIPILLSSDKTQPWCMKFSQHCFNLFISLLVLFSIFMDSMADKENLIPGKRPHSPSLSEHQPTDDAGTSPIKNTPIKRNKKPLTRRFPIPEFGIPATPVAEIYQTPTVPPYRQTPAPLTVSQNYIHRLVADRWDAEIKRCEEARKAHLLEVQLAAHGIRKLV
ncbi:hypothetical protein EDD22DRAFT_959797 [Suillus occidentalis]|nr:hypothetical protein EDD22DRAFT_959797 [Suillus occidentalis]